MIRERDRRWIREAIRLAMLGDGRTSPNPLVGAVVVKGWKVVGKGFHQRAGGDHAEVIALKEAGGMAKNGTLYTNLEPCSHTGRTPPCTETIIRSRVSKVVASHEDPNPLVSGKGLKRLKEAGIEVEVGVLEEEARGINEAYLKYIRTKIPLVILKIAATLDGKISKFNHQSPITNYQSRHWITGKDARNRVHEWRNRVDAVVVGVETVIQDNPSLTVRNVKRCKNPRRIVLDSTLRIPEGARILTDKTAPSILVTTERAPQKKVFLFEKRGIELWTVHSNREGKVDVEEFLKEVGRREITSLLVEGGSEIFTSFLPFGDKLLYFISPKIFGRGLPAFQDLKEKYSLSQSRWEQVGEDLLLEGYLKRQ